MTKTWGLWVAAAVMTAAGARDWRQELWNWALSGQAEAIETLLAENHAVDVDARDESGWTALMFASRAGHASVAALLLEAGADVDLQNDAGQTALHLAAIEGRDEVTRILLNAGADMSARDKEGRTPLYRAIERRRADVIELLQVAARASSYRTRSVKEASADAVTEPPKVIESPLPSYTDDALDKGIEGTLVLRILVRRDGSVGAVRVIEGLEESLDRRAERTIRRWRFEPALRRDRTVNVVIDVELDFELPGRDEPRKPDPQMESGGA